MNEPFEFLADEEPEAGNLGIAWLPLTVKALAAAGFLAIPVVGVFKSENMATDWSNYVQEEAIPVSLVSDEGAETVLAPVPGSDSENLFTDLPSVDETLSSLAAYSPEEEGSDEFGDGFGFSVTRQASKMIKPKGDSNEPVALRKPKTMDKARAVSDTPAIKKQDPVALTAKNALRAPNYQQPREETFAAKAPQPDQEVTVMPGDTLYSIAKRNGTTPEEMARVNGISPNEPIKPGKKLNVPNRNRSPGDATSEPVGPVKIVRPNQPPQPVIAQPKPYDEDFSNEPFARDNYQSPKNGTPYSPDGSNPGNYPIYPSGPVYPSNSSPNPLDKYNNAIAYRVQLLDNLSRIADAHGTTAAELIELNGRSSVKKGEMIVVPVDACLIKDK